MPFEMQRFPRPLARLTSKKWGTALARSVYTPLDKALYRITGGRFGFSPPKTVLYLTTTGRKSGKQRRVPILYVRDGERYWVMASNYAQERHPGWSANLLANPKATIQIGSRKRSVTARLASVEEKEEMWPRLVAVYPSWTQYREWTDRSFRLFCLE